MNESNYSIDKIAENFETPYTFDTPPSPPNVNFDSSNFSLDSIDHPVAQLNQRTPNIVSTPITDRTKLPITLFISYSLDSEYHYKLVIYFKKQLEKYNYKVHLDAFEQKQLSEDTYGWINKCFTESNYIIPIISNSYVNVVEKYDAIINSHDKQTKYIFGLMQKELISQQFKNYRFRPVILAYTKSNQNIKNINPNKATDNKSIKNNNLNINHIQIPNLFSNTIVHVWPRDASSYLKLLC